MSWIYRTVVSIIPHSITFHVYVSCSNLAKFPLSLGNHMSTLLTIIDTCVYALLYRLGNAFSCHLLSPFFCVLSPRSWILEAKMSDLGTQIVAQQSWRVSSIWKKTHNDIYLNLTNCDDKFRMKHWRYQGVLISVVISSSK